MKSKHKKILQIIKGDIVMRLYNKILHLKLKLKLKHKSKFMDQIEINEIEEMILEQEYLKNWTWQYC